MAKDTKKIDSETTDCERQLNSLYSHFGRVILDNLKNENLSYSFKSREEALENKALGLLANFNISTPETETQEEKSKEPLTPESHSSEPQANEKETPKSQTQRLKREGVEMRGLLEAYTKLNIELYEIKTALLSFKKELDDFFSTMSSHSKIRYILTEELLRKLRRVDDSLILSIESEMEVIKEAMGTKKHDIDDVDKPFERKLSKKEKAFFKKVTAEIKDISKNTGSFIKEARGILLEIKTSIDKKIEKQKLLDEEAEKNVEVPKIEKTPNVIQPDEDKKMEQDDRQLEAMEKLKSLSQVRSEVTAEEALAVGLEKFESEEVDQAEDKIEAEEIEEEEDVVQAEAEDKIEAEEIEEEEPAYELVDPGLLDTAARKLNNEYISNDEKIELLEILVNGFPTTVTEFLSKLIIEAELKVKKPLIDLLSKVDNPVMIEVYKSFLTNEDSFLRLHGIMGLSKWESDDAKAAMTTMVKDHDPNIRRLVANCLFNTSNPHELSGIISLINDPDEGVARIAIRKLGRAKNRFTFIHLIPKLNSDNVKIRKEAILALQTITGDSLGYRYAADERSRQQSVAKWKNFWSKNQTNPFFMEQIIEERKARAKSPSRSRSTISSTKPRTSRSTPKVTPVSRKSQATKKVVRKRKKL